MGDELFSYYKLPIDVGRGIGLWWLVSYCKPPIVMEEKDR